MLKMTDVDSSNVEGVTKLWQSNDATGQATEDRLGLTSGEVYVASAVTCAGITDEN